MPENATGQKNKIRGVMIGKETGKTEHKKGKKAQTGQSQINIQLFIGGKMQWRKEITFVTTKI